MVIFLQKTKFIYNIIYNANYIIQIRLRFGMANSINMHLRLKKKVSKENDC